MPEEIKGHWNGCWNLPSHHACAVEKILKLEKRISEINQSFEEVRRSYDKDGERGDLIELAARDYLRETDKLALSMAAVDAKVALLEALDGEE